MDRLPIISVNHNFRRGLSTRRQTDWLIFHHVGEMPKSPVDAKVIHRWHLARGWAGIGYNVVILPNGAMEEGRPMDAVGAHARGVNSASIGVCVVGDFTKDAPTREQIAACYNLGWAVKEKYPAIRIGGHSTFASTACPGHLFPLEEIRAKIKGGKEAVTKEELSWQQKQAISKIQTLADMGFLNDPEQHVSRIESGQGIEDFVLLTLMARIAEEVREG